MCKDILAISLQSSTGICNNISVNDVVSPISDILHIKFFEN